MCPNQYFQISRNRTELNQSEPKYNRVKLQMKVKFWYNRFRLHIIKTDKMTIEIFF